MKLIIRLYIIKSGNSFAEKLNLFQAANSDNQSLKKSFVIRKVEFDIIISALRNKKVKDPLQHELIIGRRGSGKSTLLKRIQIEIEEDKYLRKKYIAVNLAEEQAGIYRLSDLWHEVLREICIKAESEPSLRDFSDFQNNHEYTRYLYLQIQSILKKKSQKVVLLLDNLDRILENFDEDANLLRETLQNHNDFQIIGGSTRMSEHFWQYGKPFYEFFRIHRLTGLKFEEIDALLKHWSVAMQLPELENYAQNNKGKIEALRILTDGLPRTLQFFIQILLQESNLHGFDYIKQVMDKVTPLYQERLNNLTPPQRKIVLEMAFIWEATSTKELVDKCRMEGKLISSFLKQLNHFGIVETLKTDTKNHLYRLSERFFNMWLIVTQGNPEQKRKARYLTIFLEVWYNSEDLKQLANKHIVNIRNQSLPLESTVLLTKAFSQSRYLSLHLRDLLIDETSKFCYEDTLISELPVKSSEILEDVINLGKHGKLKEALNKVMEIENEEDGAKFYLMALYKAKLNHIVEAENLYKEAIKKGMPAASFNLAILYENQNKVEKSITFYKKAVGYQIDRAFYNLSLLYFKFNLEKEEALQLIKAFNLKKPNQFSLGIEIAINIWNNNFNNLDNQIENYISKYGYNNLKQFLVHLLILDQKNLSLSLFESKKHGKVLKEKYTLLYYATLIICGKISNNLELRIPSEVLHTVENIIELVKDRNAFYNLN